MSHARLHIMLCACLNFILLVMALVGGVFIATTQLLIVEHCNAMGEVPDLFPGTVLWRDTNSLGHDIQLNPRKMYCLTMYSFVPSFNHNSSSEYNRKGKPYHCRPQIWVRIHYQS